jgi:hypothetical protein
MIERIILMFLSTDRILAGFNRQVHRLRRLQHVAIARSNDIEDEVHALRNEQQRVWIESSRAGAVATKLEALLS